MEGTCYEQIPVSQWPIVTLTSQSLNIAVSFHGSEVVGQEELFYIRDKERQFSPTY